MTEITLAALRARIVEVGECWEWTGHAQGGRFPQWCVDGKVQPARRVIWRMAHDRDPGALQIGANCGNPLCVHPDHLVARNKSTAQRGKPITASHRARIAQGRRAKSRLDMETVRQIRSSPESHAEVEARLGLRTGYASRIRTGRCWQDIGHPFAGLLSRLSP